MLVARTRNRKFLPKRMLSRKRIQDNSRVELLESIFLQLLPSHFSLRCEIWNIKRCNSKFVVESRKILRKNKSRKIGVLGTVHVFELISELQFLK